MAIIVDHANRDRFAATVAEMHADRKRVFVDRLGWPLRVVAEAYEIDDYDTDDAVYLVVQDAGDGRHLGSVRLLPTTGPHLLGDKFPHACAGPVPRGAAIWEVTRLCTAPDLSPRTAATVRRQLSIALVEYGQSIGIKQFTMMTHMAFLSAVLAVGWDCEPLGMPIETGDGPVAALLLTVDAGTLARLEESWAMSQPALQLVPKASEPVA